MLITFTHKLGDVVNKIAAIKAVRNHTGAGLREAKDLVELAMETGTASCEVSGHSIAALRTDLVNAGNFDLASDIEELTDIIEQGIALAVKLREYKTARALINTLPKELRTEYLDKD